MWQEVGNIKVKGANMVLVIHESELRLRANSYITIAHCSTRNIIYILMYPMGYHPSNRTSGKINGSNTQVQPNMSDCSLPHFGHVSSRLLSSSFTHLLIQLLGYVIASMVSSIDYDRTGRNSYWWINIRGNDLFLLKGTYYIRCCVYIRDYLNTVKHVLNDATTKRQISTSDSHNLKRISFSYRESTRDA